jgi:hypothetical protein
MVCTNYLIGTKLQNRMRTPSRFIHFVKIASFFVDFLYEKTSHPITIFSLGSFLLAPGSCLLALPSSLPPDTPWRQMFEIYPYLRRNF